MWRFLCDSLGIELAVANGVFVRDRIKQEYIATLQRKFDAEAHPLTTAGAINTWVASKTKDQITDLIDKVVPLDRAFIINALYFKGAWNQAFEPHSTTTAQFHMLDGTSKTDCPMMATNEKLSYRNHKCFQAVLKPYKTKRIAAMFILPNDKGANGMQETTRELCRLYESNVRGKNFPS